MTAPSNANTSGLEVVAWRFRDHPRNGWIYTGLGGQHDGCEVEPLVTAASAQAEIDEQEETIESLKRLVDQHYDRATAAEARADRLAKALETLEAERKRDGVNLAHLKRAVAVAYADTARAFLARNGKGEG